MVQSIWSGALVVVLVSVGSVCGQQASKSSAKPAVAPGSIVTIQEAGKALRCRVITNWQMPNGAAVFKLQSVTTGEYLTVVQQQPGGINGQPQAMKIWHWGSAKASPAGAPIEPGAQLAMAPAPVPTKQLPTTPPPQARPMPALPQPRPMPAATERIVPVPQPSANSPATYQPKLLSESGATLVQVSPEPLLPPGTRLVTDPKELNGQVIQRASTPTLALPTASKQSVTPTLPPPVKQVQTPALVSPTAKQTASAPLAPTTLVPPTRQVLPEPRPAMPNRFFGMFTGKRMQQPQQAPVAHWPATLSGPQQQPHVPTQTTTAQKPMTPPGTMANKSQYASTTGLQTASHANQNNVSPTAPNRDLAPALAIQQAPKPLPLGTPQPTTSSKTPVLPAGPALPSVHEPAVTVPKHLPNNVTLPSRSPNTVEFTKPKESKVMPTKPIEAPRPAATITASEPKPTVVPTTPLTAPKAVVPQVIVKSPAPRVEPVTKPASPGAAPQSLPTAPKAVFPQVAVKPTNSKDNATAKLTTPGVMPPTYQAAPKPVFPQVDVKPAAPHSDPHAKRTAPVMTPPTYQAAPKAVFPQVAAKATPTNGTTRPALPNPQATSEKPHFLPNVPRKTPPVTAMKSATASQTTAKPGVLPNIPKQTVPSTAFMKTAPADQHTKSTPAKPEAKPLPAPAFAPTKHISIPSSQQLANSAAKPPTFAKAPDFDAKPQKVEHEKPRGLIRNIFARLGGSRDTEPARTATTQTERTAPSPRDTIKSLQIANERTAKPQDVSGDPLARMLSGKQGPTLDSATTGLPGRNVPARLANSAANDLPKDPTGVGKLATPSVAGPPVPHWPGMTAFQPTRPHTGVDITQPPTLPREPIAAAPAIPETRTPSQTPTPTTESYASPPAALARTVAPAASSPHALEKPTVAATSSPPAENGLYALFRGKRESVTRQVAAETKATPKDDLVEPKTKPAVFPVSAADPLSSLPAATASAVKPAVTPKPVAVPGIEDFLPAVKEKKTEIAVDKTPKRVPFSTAVGNTVKEPAQTVQTEKPKAEPAKVAVEETARPLAGGTSFPPYSPGTVAKATPPQVATAPEPVEIPKAKAPEPAPEPIKPAIAEEPARDWREMWGKGDAVATTLPGKTTIEQPRRLDDKVQANTPPVSVTENPYFHDPLLHPEAMAQRKVAAVQQTSFKNAQPGSGVQHADFHKSATPGGQSFDPGLRQADFNADPKTTGVEQASYLPPAAPAVDNAASHQALLQDAAPSQPSKRGLLNRLRDNINSISNAQQASLPPAEETTSLPPGAQSVVAANNGYMPRYVPVPLMTVPQPARAPAPPPPTLPQAPDPAAQMNAFQAQQPPVPPQQTGPAFNAFQRIAQQQQYQQHMMMMMAQGYQYPPQAQGQMPQMYGQMQGQMPMYPQQMTMPYQNPAYAQNLAQQQAYAQAYQQYAQQASYGQRPTAQFNVATAYQGPLPPNPTAVLQAQAQSQAQMPMPQYAAMPMPNPAMDRPAAYQATTQGAASVLQQVTLLQGSPYPAQREWAANNLTTFDWQKSPEILPAMLIAAQHDPAATVRAACIANIARKGVTLPVVLATFETMKNDNDPRVRHQAIQACTQLQSALPPQPGVTQAH